MRNSLKALIAAFAIVALSAQVYAATEPTGAVVTGATDYGQYDQGSAGSITIIESGNISGANLGANMSTYRWAGLTGNTSGDIILADAQNDTMYTWTAEGRVVYVCNDSSPSWATLSNATIAEVVAGASWAAGTDNDADRWNNTFTGAGVSLPSDIFTLTALRAQTQSSGATNWYTYSLEDGSGVLVWAGEISADGTDYQGKIADYQMIIPEDGTSGDESPSTFYVWVELR